MRKIVSLVLAVTVALTSSCAVAFATDGASKHIDKCSINAMTDSEDALTYVCEGRGHENVVRVKTDLIGYNIVMPSDFTFSQNKSTTKLLDNALKTKEINKIYVEKENLCYNGIEAENLKTTVVITDTLIKRIPFRYELPEGCNLIQNDDLFEIVNANGEHFGVVEMTETTDAAGNMIETHYELIGNTIVQTIVPNEYTQYPICLTAVNHPDKVYTDELTKSQAREVAQYIYDSYQNEELVATAISFILGGGGLKGAISVPCFIAGGLTWVAASTDMKKAKARYKLYNDKVNEMNKRDILEVKTTLRWQRHGSNDGRYRIYNEILTIL